ncbi:MAG TPA: DUF2863 family protein [Casimicrobium sp.]|jgi:hypothetical protein|nr:DUF2863 family protein [Casimicrobium sp.]
MSRAPFRRKSGAREANQLVRLAEGLASSKSRAEDVYWERELEAAVTVQLENNDEDAINRALDKAHDAPDATFDALADMVESLTESVVMDSEVGPQRLTLFCAPILVWGRNQIPAKTIPKAQLQDIGVQLAAHVFSSKAKIALADFLFAPDQLPHSYSESRELLLALGTSIRERGHLTIKPESVEDAPDVVCDMRMIVGAFQVTEGDPFYSWQEMTTSVEEARQAVLTTWRAQGGNAIKPLLVGFPHELTLPRSFFSACRDADLASRAYSIGASVSYLEAVTNTTPDKLTAVIGGCWGKGLEEYRIGFSIGDSDEVVHGCIWPLVSDENEESPVIEEIEVLLRAAKVGTILVLSEQLPLEFCDDCGAPHFPNRDGEMLHAHLPEDAETGSVHLH